MNEFIGWNELDKKFIDMEDLCFVHCGSYNSFLLDALTQEDYHIKLFNYIGKTDIEGNKIYADSSIVEFMMSGDKKRAYITWDDIQLMYDFVITNEGEFRCSYVDIYQKIYNLKIIGTLQENKELSDDN